VSRSPESLHRRLLVRSALPWAVFLSLLLLANWNSEGRQDGVIELCLILVGAALALDVRAVTTRECMEYLGQLPLDRRRIAASPYRAALVVIALIALTVHVAESSGAAYLALTLLPERLVPRLHYHHRPLAPWLNLIGFPVLSFELILLVSTWIHPRSKGRRMDPRAVLAVLLALVLPLTCVPWEVVGNGSEQLEGEHYAGLLRHNLPGLVCLAIGLVLHARNMARQAVVGFEAFTYGGDAWDS